MGYKNGGVDICHSYSLHWNGSQAPTHHSGKHKGVGIGSIKAENHRDKQPIWCLCVG